ncbi:Hypothetical protein D9617_12g037400 [Elsinoe fawcettii]|nr:Hypothetical protein D9617_12g037400 [Elsinoe fawcettii]
MLTHLDLDAIKRLPFFQCLKAPTFTPEDAIISFAIMSEFERKKYQRVLTDQEMLPSGPTGHQNASIQTPRTMALSADVPSESITPFTITAPNGDALDFYSYQTGFLFVHAPREIHDLIYSFANITTIHAFIRICNQIHQEARTYLFVNPTLDIDAGVVPLCHDAYIDNLYCPREDHQTCDDHPPPPPFYTEMRNRPLKRSRLSEPLSQAGVMGEGAIRTLPTKDWEAVQAVRLHVVFATDTLACGHYWQHTNKWNQCKEDHLRGLVLSLRLDHRAGFLALERVELVAGPELVLLREQGRIPQGAQGAVVWKEERTLSTQGGRVEAVEYPREETEDRRRWGAIKKAEGMFKKVVGVVNSVVPLEKWEELGEGGHRERWIWMLRLLGSMQASVQHETELTVDGGAGHWWFWNS